MKDMYGKEVVNGDFLLDVHEEFCHLFRVEDDKLVMRAIFGLVSEKLSKLTIETMSNDIKEKQRIIKEESYPEWLHNHYQKMVDRLVEIRSEELVKERDERNNVIFEKFIREDHESIDYIYNDGTGEVIAKFPDRELVGSM